MQIDVLFIIHFTSHLFAYKPFLNFQLTNTTTWLWIWLPHRLSKLQSLTTVLLRTPVTQMIFFNHGIQFIFTTIPLQLCGTTIIIRRRRRRNNYHIIMLQCIILQYCFNVWYQDWLNMNLSCFENNYCLLLLNVWLRGFLQVKSSFLPQLL